MADRRRGSAAVYDIPSYTEQRNIKHSEPSHSAARIKRVTKKDEAPGTYTKLFAVFITAVAVFSAVISAKVESADIRSKINDEQKRVDVLRSENTRMQAEIETKISRKAVESYAEDILGMQKLDKSQCEYITLESGNVIEIPETEESFFVRLYNDISELFEYPKG